MKRILLIATLILVTIAGVKAQDVFTSFSARIGNLSVNYNNAQVSDLLYQHYGVPVNTLNSLYNSYDRNWGDVTMALEMSNHFNIPVSRIHTCYAKNKGKGWGVIAKDLNINATIISTVEGRKVKASDRVRYKLSSFYGVPEEELFSGDRYAI